MDYDKRALVLDTSLCYEQRQISRALAGFNSIYTYETALNKQSFFMDTCPTLYKEAEKANKASYERRNRLFKRIYAMVLYSPCLFVTLTFRNDILDNTSKDTRRQYVRRFLSSFGVPYVANIDFGATNEREHYHAVIMTNNIECSYWFDKCGYIKCEHIHSDKTDCKKLAKYISKLTNHAIKETTKRNYIIYSRDTSIDWNNLDYSFIEKSKDINYYQRYLDTLNMTYLAENSPIEID